MKSLILIVAILFVAGFAYSADTVHVWLKPTEVGGKGYHASVDAADGSFSFPEVATGEYEIRLEEKEHFHEGNIPPQVQFVIEIEKFGLGSDGKGSISYKPEVRSHSKLNMSSGKEAGTLTGLLGKVWVSAEGKTTQLQGHLTFIKEKH